jgi:lambda repressor-like predicted transcriptional regulator
MSIEKPGSLLDYARREGLDPNRANLAYSRHLDAYRHLLAEELGISVEELHMRGNLSSEPLNTDDRRDPLAEGQLHFPLDGFRWTTSR